MFPIDLKKGKSLTLSHHLISHLKNNKYNTSPYEKILLEIDSLRNECLICPIDESSIHKLTRYYQLLLFIDKHFSIRESSPIKISFSWNNSATYYKQAAITCNDIKFEQASILFNLAALYSQLALICHQQKDYKKSCSHSMAAAGLFKHIQDAFLNVSPVSFILPSTSDLSVSAMEIYETIMLAQAQQSFVLKAIEEKSVKDGTIAKLSISASNLYDQVYDKVMSSNIRDWSSLLTFLMVNSNYFCALSKYRKSIEQESQSHYGIQIAYLRSSLEHIQKSLELYSSKNMNKKLMPINLLNGLESQISHDFERMKKENELIYHENIPATTSDFGTALVVKHISPQLDNDSNIEDPFKNLLSLQDHNKVLQNRSRIENAHSILTNFIIYNIQNMTEIINQIKEMINDEEIEDFKLRKEFPTLSDSIVESSILNKEMREEIENFIKRIPHESIGNQLQQEKDSLLNKFAINHLTNELEQEQEQEDDKEIQQDGMIINEQKVINLTDRIKEFNDRMILLEQVLKEELNKFLINCKDFITSRNIEREEAKRQEMESSSNQNQNQNQIQQDQVHNQNQNSPQASLYPPPLIAIDQQSTHQNYQSFQYSNPSLMPSSTSTLPSQYQNIQSNQQFSSLSSLPTLHAQYPHHSSHYISSPFHNHQHSYYQHHHQQQPYQQQHSYQYPAHSQYYNQQYSPIQNIHSIPQSSNNQSSIQSSLGSSNTSSTTTRIGGIGSIGNQSHDGIGSLQSIHQHHVPSHSNFPFANGASGSSSNSSANVPSSSLYQNYYSSNLPLQSLNSGGFSSNVSQSVHSHPSHNLYSPSDSSHSNNNNAWMQAGMPIRYSNNNPSNSNEHDNVHLSSSSQSPPLPPRSSSSTHLPTK